MAVNVICECGHKHSFHWNLDGECGVAGCTCKAYEGHSAEVQTVDRLVPEVPPISKPGFAQPESPTPNPEPEVKKFVESAPGPPTHDEVRPRVRNGDPLPGPETETVPVPDDGDRKGPDRKNG